MRDPMEALLASFSRTRSHGPSHAEGARSNWATTPMAVGGTVNRSVTLTSRSGAALGALPRGAATLASGGETPTDVASGAHPP